QTKNGQPDAPFEGITRLDDCYSHNFKLSCSYLVSIAPGSSSGRASGPRASHLRSPGTGEARTTNASSSTLARLRLLHANMSIGPHVAAGDVARLPAVPSPIPGGDEPVRNAEQDRQAGPRSWGPEDRDLASTEGRMPVTRERMMLMKTRNVSEDW